MREVQNLELNICNEKAKFIEFKEHTTLLFIFRDQFVWAYF